MSRTSKNHGVYLIIFDNLSLSLFKVFLVPFYSLFGFLYIFIYHCQSLVWIAAANSDQSLDSPRVWVRRPIPAISVSLETCLFNCWLMKLLSLKTCINSLLFIWNCILVDLWEYGTPILHVYLTAHSAPRPCTLNAIWLKSYLWSAPTISTPLLCVALLCVATSKMSGQIDPNIPPPRKYCTRRMQFQLGEYPCTVQNYAVTQ